MFGNINPNKISVPIRVHNLAYKAVKNMRVKKCDSTYGYS